MKILAADDDKAVQRLYQRVFVGHELRVVSEGSEGVKLVTGKLFEPDVVFSDYDMGIGYMNGVSFCTALRQAGFQVPFILVTSNFEARKLAEDCGAQFGLRKPFLPRQLWAVIGKFVPGHGVDDMVEDNVSFDELEEVFSKKA